LPLAKSYRLKIEQRTCCVIPKLWRDVPRRNERISQIGAEFLRLMFAPDFPLTDSRRVLWLLSFA
jgi:hypothetical protein